MERDEIRQQVLGFLTEMLGEEDGSGGPAEAGDLVLDSLAVVQVVTFLEERFALTLERSDLDYIETPDGIVDLVLAKRSAGG